MEDLLNNNTALKNIDPPNKKEPIESEYDKKIDRLGNEWLDKDLALYNRDSNIKVKSYNAGSQGTAYMDRYKGYGQDVYEEIGFSPYEDNEKNFNEGTGAIDEFKRSIQYGFMPLFAQGFVSGPKSLAKMAQGDFSDDPEDAEVYAKASAIASSTKGGLTGFTSNLALNFGFTAGIIMEAIGEEILTRGLSTPFTISKLGMKLDDVSKIGKISRLSTVKSKGEALKSSLKTLDNINESRNYWEGFKKSKQASDFSRNASKIKETTTIGKIIDFVNPVTNTVDAILDVTKNSKNLTGLARLNDIGYKTAGGLYRDIRNINMALSEGRLEAGFSRNETFTELFNEYTKENPDLYPDAELQTEWRNTADKVSKASLLANTLVIFASNKIMFKNVLNPTRGLGKFISKKAAVLKSNLSGRIVREFTEQTLKTGKKVVTPKLNVIKKGWNGWKGSLVAAKKLGPQKVIKGVIGYTKVNLTEGVQEVLQNVIARTSKEQYLESFFSEPIASYYYTEGFLNTKQKDDKSIMGHLGDAFASQFSAEGLETFAGGFAMGTFAGPLNNLLPAVQSRYYKIKNKQEYTDAKKQLDQYNDNIVDRVNKSFGSNPLNMYNSRIFNYGVQMELSKKIMGTDEKSSKDAVHDATQRQILEMINTSSTDIWIEHLENLKKLTTEEYAEYAGISVEEAADFNTRLDNIISKTKNITKNYEELNEQYPNPTILSDYKKGSIEYQKASIYYKAWEDSRNNLIFYNEDYKDNIKRMSDIYDSLGKIKILNNKESSQIQVLLNDENLNSQIDILKIEIKNLEEINNPESLKKLNNKKDTLKALNEYKRSFDNFMDHFYNPNKEETTIYRETEDQVQALQNKIDAINNKVKDGKEYTKGQASKINSYYNQIDKARALYASNSEFINNLVSNGLEKSFKEYINVIADLKGESTLDTNIDDAFLKLVDYFRLGKEAVALANTVNMLNQPEEFEKHVENNFNWMSDLWNNRENLIKQNITEQIKRIKYNNLLNELAAQGIYVDLEEFANWKNTGELPTEYYDNNSKLVIKKGSILYNETNQKFLLLDNLLQTVEKYKSPEQKLEENIKELDLREIDDINDLQTYPTKQSIKSIDGTFEINLNTLGINQYIEATYLDDSIPKKIIAFNDSESGIIYYESNSDTFNENNIKVLEFAKYESFNIDGKIKFSNGEIFDIIDQPDPVVVNQIKEKYNSYRAEAAENSISQGGQVKDTDIKEEPEIDPSNFDSLPDDLKTSLQKSFEDYKNDPVNRLQFPVGITDDELNDKFLNYIEKNTDAKEIIDEYNTKIKLENAINEGTASAPSYVLPSGKTINADEATLEQNLAQLTNLQLQVQTINAKTSLSPKDKVEIKNLNTDIALLKTYINNEQNKDLDPKIIESLKLIEELQSKQENIQKQDSGYLINGKVLDRVTNVIQDFLEEKYSYSDIDKIKAAFNIGFINKNVDEFIDALKVNDPVGFTDKSYTILRKYMIDNFTTDTKASVNISEDEAVSVSTPRKLFKARLSRIKENQEGKRKADYTAGPEGYVVSLKSDKFNENDNQGRPINVGAEVYLNEEEITEIKRIEAKRAKGFINANEKSEALQQVYRDAFKRALDTYEIVEDAEFETEVKDRRSKYNATTTDTKAVDELRAKEIAEFEENVENFESFIKDGKIDKELVDKSGDDKAKEIYDRYDILIREELDATKNTEKTIDDIIKYINENVAFISNTEAGNYIDEQSKNFFNNVTPKFDDTKITQKAFDNIFGKGGVLEVINTYITSNQLRVISNGLVVYDEVSQVAGEIDLLVIDKNGNFQIIDIKTGNKDKWDGYNNEKSSNYKKQIENTYQQMVYARLLKNMFNVDAKINILPIQIEIENNSSKILTAIRPDGKLLLKDKIVFPLVPTQDMQNKVDERIPLKDNINNNQAAPIVTPVNTTDAFNKLKESINNADFDELQMLEVGIITATNKYTIDELAELSKLIELRYDMLKPNTGNNNINYIVGSKLIAKNDIFTEQKNEFVKSNNEVIISKINKNEITLKNSKNIEMSININDIATQFDLVDDLFNQSTEESTIIVEEGVITEVSDVLNNMLNDPATINNIKDSSKDITAEEADNALLNDLDC